jgi:hypothetical protein
MEDLKKLDEVDRLTIQLLIHRVKGATAQYERLQEEKKRISLEEPVLASVVGKLQKEYEATSKALLEKYGIEDFDLETGVEVRK